MNKAIFWDLQGTLGGDAVGSIENFIPYSFSKDALMLSKNNGYINIIITNQSNIGKGLLSFEIYQQEAERIVSFLILTKSLLMNFFVVHIKARTTATVRSQKLV